MSPTAIQILELTESANNFFDIERDLAVLVPKQQQLECFYALKNGFVAPNCPAQFIYLVKTIYSRYHIGNIIAPMLPRDVGKRLCASNYFGAGYTGVDVIRNFANEKFQPITPERLIVRCGDWYEAFVPKHDAVIALPLDVGKMLHSADMLNIEFVPGSGFRLEGRALCVLAGSSNFYDLRRAI
jgi:hypothetical protein